MPTERILKGSKRTLYCICQQWRPPVEYKIFEFSFYKYQCETSALHRETISSSTGFLWSLGKTPIHSGTSSVSDPDPNWIRIQSGQRIQAGQSCPRKELMKNLMFEEAEGLLKVYRTIFDIKKSNNYFFNFERKNLDSCPDWIRIQQNTWIRIVPRLGEPMYKATLI